MCSKILLYTIIGKWASHKTHVFWPIQGPKNFRKGTRPAGRVPSKRYSSYFDFHSSIFQSIQTERVPKQSFPPSDFGRLLELMQFQM